MPESAEYVGTAMRAICSICGREYGITKDGHLRRHDCVSVANWDPPAPAIRATFTVFLGLGGWITLDVDTLTDHLSDQERTLLATVLHMTIDKALGLHIDGQADG